MALPMQFISSALGILLTVFFFAREPFPKWQKVYEENTLIFLLSTKG